MKPKTSYAEYLKNWRNLLGHIASDATLTETLAAQRPAALATVVAQIDEILQLQAQRDAAKQTSTEDVRRLIVQGRELSRDIKLELKGRFGARSLELVKFRLSPLRLTRTGKTIEQETPPPGGSEGGPSPVAGAQVNPSGPNGTARPNAH
jgi:hypothetical protein